MYSLTQTQTAPSLGTAHFTTQSHLLADLLERYPLDTLVQNSVEANVHGWAVTFLTQMMAGERTESIERLQTLVAPHFARFDELTQNASAPHRFVQDVIAWRRNVFVIAPPVADTTTVVLRMPQRTQNAPFNPADILATMRQMRQNLERQTGYTLDLSAANRKLNETRLVDARDAARRQEAEIIQSLQSAIDACTTRVDQMTRQMESNQEYHDRARAQFDTDLRAVQASNDESARMIRAEMDATRAETQRTQVAQKAELQAVKAQQAQKERELKAEQDRIEACHQQERAELEAKTAQEVSRLEARILGLGNAVNLAEARADRSENANEQLREQNVMLNGRLTTAEHNLAFEQSRSRGGGWCSLM